MIEVSALTNRTFAGRLAMRTNGESTRTLGWPAAPSLLTSLILIAWFVLTVGAWFVGGIYIEMQTLGRMADRGTMELNLHAGFLLNALNQFNHLPAIASAFPDVDELLAHPNDPALLHRVNMALDQFNRQAGTNALYLMTAEGRVIAASNHSGANSFIGDELAFRPYFQEAMREGDGRFYGIGTTQGHPGYYYARAIDIDGVRRGVMAVKIGIESLEGAWRQGPSHIIALDANRVVFLSTHEPWRYRLMQSLSREALATVQTTRQYDGASLEPLGFVRERNLSDDTFIAIVPMSYPRGEPQRFLAVERKLEGTPWTLLLLHDAADLVPVVRTARILFIALCGAVLLGFLLLRQRWQMLRLERSSGEALAQSNRNLEFTVRQRTRDLLDSNLKLQGEIAERIRAEGERQRMQDELVHAGKLVALGQMATAVAHELNQPLSALQALSDSARQMLGRMRIDDVVGNLSRYRNW